MRSSLAGAVLGLVVTPFWETELLRFGHVLVNGSDREFWGFLLWIPEAVAGILIGALLGTAIDLGKLRKWVAIAIYLIVSLILPIGDMLFQYYHGWH